MCLRDGGDATRARRGRQPCALCSRKITNSVNGDARSWRSQAPVWPAASQNRMMRTPSLRQVGRGRRSDMASGVDQHEARTTAVHSVARKPVFTVRHHHDDGYVQVIRSDVPFTSASEASRAYTKCRVAVADVPMTACGILLDFRQAPMSTDSRVHRALVEQGDALTTPFCRRAVLLATPVGVMQTRRVARTYSNTPPEIFSDEDTARRYVNQRWLRCEPARAARAVRKASVKAVARCEALAPIIGALVAMLASPPPQPHRIISCQVWLTLKPTRAAAVFSCVMRSRHCDASSATVRRRR
jgi:hypothetical protein